MSKQNNRFTVIVKEDEESSRFDQLKDGSKQLLTNAKEKYKQFNEREDVCATKEKVKDLASKAVDGVSDGIDKVLSNEHVSKVVDQVQEKVNQVRSDERVQMGIKKLKKGTLNCAQQAYEGLRKVLEEEEEN